MSTHFPDDDPLAARLSDALSSEADMVQTSDNGLQRIRERTEAAHRPWWQHPGVLAVAAAVVLGAAVGVGFAVLGGDEGGNNIVATDPSTEAPTPSETDSAGPTATESPSPTTEPVGPQAVYVYYLMDDGQGPRLYREIHPGVGSGTEAVGAQKVADSVRTMLADSPDDRDYSSPWPSGTRLLDVSISGDTATVDLSRFVSVGAQAETVAVQQLVYTVTANDNSVKKVRLVVNGETPQSGHTDWSQPIGRAPMLDVQGMIWLLAPTEGATVSSPVQIDGYGTAFEATISWEVRKGGPDGAVVAEGHTQGGANGEFGEFHDTVDLPPGTYEIRAFESSAEDGRPLHVDTKTFQIPASPSPSPGS